jgi:hypothetical protein
MSIDRIRACPNSFSDFSSFIMRLVWMASASFWPLWPPSPVSTLWSVVGSTTWAAWILFSSGSLPLLSSSVSLQQTTASETYVRSFAQFRQLTKVDSLFFRSCAPLRVSIEYLFRVRPFLIGQVILQTVIELLLTFPVSLSSLNSLEIPLLFISHVCV